MPVTVSSRFVFEVGQPTDTLMQFEAAQMPEQKILSARSMISQGGAPARVPAHDSIGTRIWLRASGRIEVDYEAQVAVDRPMPDIASLGAVPLSTLPGETVQYLLDSRYCRSEQFQHFASTQFGASSGGERVEAICDWVANAFSYVPGASNASTDAAESFITRQGICRDYAHVVIALARASMIPARFVACYAPGVTPQDFHAVAEVFLTDPTKEASGNWHLVDATQMADPAQTVKIGVGRDAGDVSFLTTFGPSTFLSCAVEVSEA